MGRFEPAVADFSATIDAHPRATFAITHRALAYAGQGETRQALEELHQASEFSPKYFLVWNTLAEVIPQHYRPQHYRPQHYRPQHYEGVEREWQRASQLAPKDPRAAFLFGSWQLLAGLSDEYHAMVQRIVEDAAKLEGHPLSLAAVLCALDPVAVQEASIRDSRLEIAERAIAEGPDWCQTQAAMVRVRCGQVNEGLATLRQLSERINSEDQPALIAAYLAVALDIQGEPDATRDAWHTVAATNPDDFETLRPQIEFETLQREFEARLGSGRPSEGVAAMASP